MSKFMAVVDTYPGSCQVCNEVQWVGQISVTGDMLRGSVCSKCLCRLAEEVECHARALGGGAPADPLSRMSAGTQCPRQDDLDQLMAESESEADHTAESPSAPVVEPRRGTRWVRVGGLIGAGCCVIAFAAALWLGLLDRGRQAPAGFLDAAESTEPVAAVPQQVAAPQPMPPAAPPDPTVLPEKVMTRTAARLVRPVVAAKRSAPRDEPAPGRNPRDTAPTRNLKDTERQPVTPPLNVSYYGPGNVVTPAPPPASEVSVPPIRQVPPVGPEAAPLAWAQPIS